MKFFSAKKKFEILRKITTSSYVSSSGKMCIVSTSIDQNKEKETLDDYKKRSIKELVKAVPEQIYKKDIVLMFKTTQTVIHKKNEKGIRRVYSGHTEVSAVRMEDDRIEILVTASKMPEKDEYGSETFAIDSNSSLMKIKQKAIFEDEKTIERKIISHLKNSENNNSGTMYVFIPVNETNLPQTEKSLRDLVSQSKLNDEGYDSEKDACGQFLQRVVGSVQGKSISAQTATMQAIIHTLKNEELKYEFQMIAGISRFDKRADILVLRAFAWIG
jgi:hypothetical protein